jgi:hydroxyacylglutathione hydrolase
MRPVAPEVWQIDGFPAHAVNAYVVGDVLIDAGTRFWTKKLLRALAGRRVSLVALTHVHPDHQGAAAALCAAFNCPLACGEADRCVMEGREPMRPGTRLLRLSAAMLSGPPYPVAQSLRDGDRVGDLRVVATPGHTPGHVAFFRESDRLAIVGDALLGMSLLTTRRGLHEPLTVFTHDPVENRRSIRRIAALGPETLLFGHGPPLRDRAALEAFAAALPAEGGAYERLRKAEVVRPAR